MEIFNNENNEIKQNIDIAKLLLKDKLKNSKEKGINILLDMADKGSSEAYYLLGEAYYSGTVVPCNKEEAEAYLQEAAEEGHSAAKVLLGKIYMKKQGVLWKKKGIKLFKEAAEAKLPEAIFLYALELLRNDSKSKNGIDLMYEAADYGVGIAGTYCGLHQDSLGHFENSFRYYIIASENDVLAKRLLADRYMYGDITVDEKIKLLEKMDGDNEEYEYAMWLKSFNLYKKAAEQGDLASKFNQAIYHRDGIYRDTSSNKKIAIDILMDAAEQLYYPAIKYLQELANDICWQKYFNAAYDIERLKWLEEKTYCTKADNFFSQKNYAEAFKLYQAKARFNTYAKIRTAHCLMFGYGVEKNTYNAATALEEIISNSRTKYNPLAQYLMSYYLRCILYSGMENGRKKSVDESNKEKNLYKAKECYRNAKRYIQYVFKDIKDFKENIDKYIPQCELDLLLAEIEDESDNGMELVDKENLLTENDRRNDLLRFLQSIKGRMEYRLVNQDTYGKYAKGSREISKEDTLRAVVFDAHLTLKECHDLYSLAKLNFDPLKYVDHRSMEIVLTDQYKSVLSEAEISTAVGLDDIYNMISKRISQSKLTKIAR